MELNKREKTGLLIFSLIIVTLLSIIYFNGKNKTIEVVQEEQKISENSSEKNGKDIIVYVDGEVKRPGLYTLREGDRVSKALEAAGGTTENADIASIQPARKLRDEETIIVRPKAAVSQNGSVQSGISVYDGKVNINTATKEELMTLDGIGDTLAQRIIDYRTKNGLFSDILDLKKVSGIGEGRYKAIENKITVY